LLLFIIGIVLPFSLTRRREQGQSLRTLYFHSFKRSILLIVLGSIPGGLFNFDHWPRMGGVRYRAKDRLISDNQRQRKEDA